MKLVFAILLAIAYRLWIHKRLARSFGSTVTTRYCRVVVCADWRYYLSSAEVKRRKIQIRTQICTRVAHMLWRCEVEVLKESGEWTPMLTLYEGDHASSDGFTGAIERYLEKSNPEAHPFGGDVEDETLREFIENTARFLLGENDVLEAPEVSPLPQSVTKTV
jgi:hypothetical protein